MLIKIKKQFFFTAIILLHLLLGVTKAQSSALDSLKEVYGNAKADTSRVNVLNSMAIEFFLRIYTTVLISIQ